MFKLEKVKNDDNYSLNRIKNIYESSFPENERRDFEDVIKLLTNQQFTLFSIKFEIETVGMLSVWEFSEFSYIEHFAIDEDFRSEGIGTYILKQFISKQEKQIILEVDLPNDNLSLKRIRFYESFGFNICREEYIQPPYSKFKEAVPMLIMSKPEIISFEEFESIKAALYHIVYNVSEKH
jgi:ribosomal protein S18 acetylase RimI-like enzyme